VELRKGFFRQGHLASTKWISPGAARQVLPKRKSPYWFDGAYATPMNLSKTGVLARNTCFSGFMLSLFGAFFSAKARFLDYAGGFRVMKRMMRGTSFAYFCRELYTKMCRCNNVSVN
jgi:hypothetical protein